MAIEEPSVIAAVSKAAKIAKVRGGFIAEADDSLMIGQVQVVRLGNVKHAMTKILRNKKQLLATANSNSRSVTAVDLQVRQLRQKPKQYGQYAGRRVHRHQGRHGCKCDKHYVRSNSAAGG